MKYFYPIILLLFFIFDLSAQNHDAHWILGYSPVDFGIDSTLGKDDGVLFDFTNGELDVQYFPKNVRVFETAMIMSDSVGIFQFYSNGKAIYNAENELIENGDSINYGQFYWDDFPSYPVPQGSLALPIPQHPDQYFIFHQFIENLPDIAGLIVAMKGTHLDMSQNAGKGKVLKKNMVLLQDTLNYGQLTGVKHGNGRDWWILQPEYRSNKYYKWLLTPKGVQGSFEQRIGKTWSRFDWSGQAKFNRDGSKYIRYDIDDDLSIFDFDRCSGELSNPIHIAIQDSADLYPSAGGVAISPNNRFLYVSSFFDLYQFDLEANDIAASKVQIAHYQSNITNFPPYYYLAEEAPDGKIYVMGSSGNKYLHIIHEPNNKGLACDFQQFFELEVYNGRSVPNHANFRLGALKDSPCDSLSIVEPCKYDYIVYPNPASDFIKIQRCDSEKTQLFKLYDTLGKLVLVETLTENDPIPELPISFLQTGMYLYQITESDKMIYQGKLIISR